MFINLLIIKISDRLNNIKLIENSTGVSVILRAEDVCETGTRRRKTFRKGWLRQAAESLSEAGKVAAFAAMEDMLVSDPEINYKTDGRSL